MIRIIREEDPPSLASRLSTRRIARRASRRCAAVEPKRLLSLVNGELDWIVHRCLEKDRNRRYETANALARDVQRYLADEPVEAGPPAPVTGSGSCFAGHRYFAAAAASTFAALVLGVAGTSWQAYRATIAESQAKENAKLAGDRLLDVIAEQKRTLAQKERALANEQAATVEREVAVAVRQFLQNDLLGQGSPWLRAKARRSGGSAPNPSVRELLDRAADRLMQPSFDRGYRARPQVNAEIFTTVADAYQSVGEYGRAISLLRKAVEFQSSLLTPDDDVLVLCKCRLAAAYFRSERARDVASEVADMMGTIERNLAVPPNASPERSLAGLRQLDRFLKTLEEQISEQPTAKTFEIEAAELPVHRADVAACGGKYRASG